MMNAETMSGRYDVMSQRSMFDLGGSGYSECSGNCKLRFVPSADRIPSADEKEADSAEWEYVILCYGTTPKAAVSVFPFCPRCGGKLDHVGMATQSQMSLPRGSLMNQKSATPGLKQMTSSGQPADQGAVSECSGSLKMDVGKFRQLKTRYVVLHGKFLYIYKKETKPFPETVVFIQVLCLNVGWNF